MKILAIDDHDVTLRGTLNALTEKYPDSTILWAQAKDEADKILLKYDHLDLVVLDLSLPAHQGDEASASVGVDFMKGILTSRSAPNIMILSANIKPVVRLKGLINSYAGGVTMLDKSQSLNEMLILADLAMRGSICWPQQIRGWLNKEAFRKEFDESWLTVLKLRMEEGLNDKGIAKRLHVTERTVRNYWVRLQDNLCLAQDPEKDFHMQIYLAAKELGLVD